MLNPTLEENENQFVRMLMVIIFASLYIYGMMLASFFMEYNTFNFWFLVLTSLAAMGIIFGYIGKANFRFK